MSPAVGGKNWVTPTGGVSAAPVYRTAADWGVTAVSGLSDGTLYQFLAKARNLEGIETIFGPAAEATTLADLIPSVAFMLISATETAADTIEFLVTIDEPTVPEFGPAAVMVLLAINNEAS